MVPSISEEIIIRSIRKTATQEELEILNAWLKEDKKNTEYYFQLEEIWSSHKEISQKNIYVGWEKLSTEINKRPHLSQPIPQKRKSLIWLRYVAAVCIGIIIASVVWMNFPGRHEPARDILVRNAVYNSTGVQSLHLPDNSQVWLNEDTRVIYPEQFTGQRREISMEGKAYFDIHKDSTRPFIVRIGTIEVEVTGTEFFIESLSQEEVHVTLVSGGVDLRCTNQTGYTSFLSLTPGQQAAINNIDGDMNVSEIDTNYYVVWKDGIYRFNDEPLEKIAGLLAKRFDLDICVSPSLKNKRFTGRISSREDIEDVLTTFNKSYPVKYKITGNKVQITES